MAEDDSKPPVKQPRPPIRKPPPTRGRATLSNGRAVLAGQTRRRAIAPRQILEKLDATGNAARALNAGLAHQTILELAKRLRPSERLDLDRAIAEVKQAVEIALECMRVGKSASDYQSLVSDALREAAAQTAAGEIDLGLATIEAALDALNRLEAEQGKASQNPRKTLLEAALRQDLLRRDILGVVRRIEALEDLGGSVRVAWTPGYIARAEAFYEEGRRLGVNLTIRIAGEMARQMMNTANLLEEYGDALLRRGRALRTLGERGDNGAQRRLVTEYRNALMRISRQQQPRIWANLQKGLGDVLTNQGERAKKSKLAGALNAYGLALSVFNRKEFPFEWALVRNGMGNTLRILGERHDVQHLNESILAYRDAAEVLNREDFPNEWAILKNNMGNVLKAFGELGDNESLRQSVDAFRASQEVCDRKTAPADWARTQNNLGNSLVLLGRRLNSEADIRDAVIAYEAALEVRNRQEAPAQWANTKHNLGTALSTLGQWGDAISLQRAIQELKDALEIRTRLEQPYFWAQSTENLARAEAALASRTQDLHMMIVAHVRAQQALDEFGRQNAAQDFARVGRFADRLAEVIQHSSRR